MGTYKFPSRLQSITETPPSTRVRRREPVERLRQAVFDLEYAVEEYLARVCHETEPWDGDDDGDDDDGDDGERTPSWHPGSLPAESHVDSPAGGATDGEKEH